MDLDHIENVMVEDRAFVREAAVACDQVGPNSVLLLVGSRAAGLHPMDDLDLWIIGDHRRLSAAQQHEYAGTGRVFVDRGNLEAHWTFYDLDDLNNRLMQWPAEIMWILSTSRFLSGCQATRDDLLTRSASFPKEIAGSKLKWLIGSYRMYLHPMFKAAAAGSATAAFAIGGEAISALARLCCVAECRPWPYSKWLTRIAGTTKAGKVLMPFADRCVEAFARNPLPSQGQRSVDWPPTRELKQAMEAIPRLLSEMSWQEDWVSDPWEAVDESFKRAAP
jgi:hypothetical protein